MERSLEIRRMNFNTRSVAHLILHLFQYLIIGVGGYDH